MGGLTVARMSGDAEAQVVSIKPKGKWPLLLAVPTRSYHQRSPPGAPGAVFPRRCGGKHSEFHVLLAAFMQGRHELLASALEDRIHQPYRAPLCRCCPACRS